MWLTFLMFSLPICWLLGRFPAYRLQGLIAFTLAGLWVFGLPQLGILVGAVWLCLVPNPQIGPLTLLIWGSSLLSFMDLRLSILGGGALAASFFWLKQNRFHAQFIPICLAGLILGWGMVKFRQLEWLGFSYLILRLIMLCLEARQNRLSPMAFPEFLIYTCLPLTFLAGPIAGPEGFWASLGAVSDGQRWQGLKRIVWGSLQKFILADSLALIALSPQLSADIKSGLGAWIITYAYAWRLFWDFSGYTHIVLGLGLWVGFHLPENFKQPYFKSNLALFWQNWHISLTDWFRVYVFLPFTREGLRRKSWLPLFLLGQLLTMSLIGLWHGMSLNFLLWGVWHALGLWVYRLWSKFSPWHLPQMASQILTFHYVTLGWVWFALPEPQMSLAHFAKLAGL